MMLLTSKIIQTIPHSLGLNVLINKWMNENNNDILPPNWVTATHRATMPTVKRLLSKYCCNRLMQPMVWIFASTFFLTFSSWTPKPHIIFTRPSLLSSVWTLFKDQKNSEWIYEVIVSTKMNYNNLRISTLVSNMGLIKKN